LIGSLLNVKMGPSIILSAFGLYVVDSKYFINLYVKTRNLLKLGYLRKYSQEPINRFHILFLGFWCRVDGRLLAGPRSSN
jgi:hypothetical protein